MYRVNAEERLEEIAIASAPHLEKSSYENLISGYQRASDDIIEKFTEQDDDFSGLEALKKNLS